MQMRIHNAEIEQLDRGALLDLQWRKVKLMIEHAYSNSSFYRDRFRQAGITPDDIRSIEDYQERVPTVDKITFLKDQEDCSPYGRRIAVGQEKLSYTFLTSGTSGVGQEVHCLTAQDMQSVSDSWAMALRWSGVNPGDTAFLIAPIGITAGPVSLLSAFHQYGLQTFAVGHMSGEESLSLMRRFPPHFFSAGPVYLRRLSNICLEMGLDPRNEFPDLKTIKLGGFGYAVEWAVEMEGFWGAKLLDTYASTQAGAGIASTCEHGVHLPDGSRAIMHFPEHKILAEIVNPETGKNAREDEEGEVILTPFDRMGMPLLRFRTGDRVIKKSHLQCSCGRPFDGIEAGTVSRYDSMMKIRGMNLWPEAVDAVVFGYDEIDEYNGRVSVNTNGREVVELLVEFKPDVLADEQARIKCLESIEKKVKEKTNVKVKLLCPPEGTVKRFSYKERRWQDLRKQGM